MPATASLPQQLTPYHAKYYAYELTRRCPPDSDDRLASALVDAQVDLNPHQVDAALFTFRSPLSRGVLLADRCCSGPSRPPVEGTAADETTRPGRKPLRRFPRVERPVVM